MRVIPLRVKNYLWDLCVNGVLASYLLPYQIRNIGLKCLGIEINKNSAVHGHCYISGSNLVIKENSYINRRCLIDTCHGNIKIGRNVGIAYDCKLITTSHMFDNAQKRTGNVITENIEIGDGVWVGTGSIILPGVTIQNGVVIAAGSVVTKNCKENYLYAGIPAKPIKKLLSV